MLRRVLWGVRPKTIIPKGLGTGPETDVYVGLLWLCVTMAGELKTPFFLNYGARKEEFLWGRQKMRGNRISVRKYSAPLLDMFIVKNASREFSLFYGDKSYDKLERTFSTVAVLLDYLSRRLLKPENMFLRPAHTPTAAPQLTAPRKKDDVVTGTAVTTMTAEGYKISFSVDAAALRVVAKLEAPKKPELQKIIQVEKQILAEIGESIYTQVLSSPPVLETNYPSLTGKIKIKKIQIPRVELKIDTHWE